MDSVAGAETVVMKKEIKEHLCNEVLLPDYTVASVRKYGDSRYGVRMEKVKIRIV